MDVSKKCPRDYPRGLRGVTHDGRDGEWMGREMFDAVSNEATNAKSFAHVRPIAKLFPERETSQKPEEEIPCVFLLACLRMRGVRACCTFLQRRNPGPIAKGENRDRKPDLERTPSSNSVAPPVESFGLLEACGGESAGRLTRSTLPSTREKHRPSSSTATPARAPCLRCTTSVDAQPDGSSWLSWEKGGGMPTYSRASLKRAS